MTTEYYKRALDLFPLVAERLVSFQEEAANRLLRTWEPDPGRWDDGHNTRSDEAAEATIETILATKLAPYFTHYLGIDQPAEVVDQLEGFLQLIQRSRPRTHHFYHGGREPGAGTIPGPVWVSDRADRWEDDCWSLDLRRNLVDHSDGLNWGYCGSGPCQLALAILADYLSDDDRALAQYQAFKADVIAKLGDSWSLTPNDLDRWLEHAP